MSNLEIRDIVKTAINYYTAENEISENGFVEISYKTSSSRSDDKPKKQRADLKFKLILTSNNAEEDEERVSEQNEDYKIAEIEMDYRMFVEKSTEITEKEILYYLEPYIRKEIFDFLSEARLPKIPLPYRFWENEKEE